ncbi:MAG: hypothetical protein HQK54_02710 [Oligoflexales bacterium]|nr:hypothetical protein [Oligoflexales bacterium]
MNYYGKFSIFSFSLLLSGVIYSGAFAEDSEPVDTNYSGAFINGGINFGQVYSAGDSYPGIGVLFTFEPGYTSAQNPWNRLETSLEFGMGQITYKRKGNDAMVELPINLSALAKFGYGYSIGNHSFGVLRAGAGPIFAGYKEKLEGVPAKTKTLTGFGALLGIDAVVPMSDELDFIGGFYIKYMTFSGSNIDSFQLNVPMFNTGIRYQF